MLRPNGTCSARPSQLLYLLALLLLPFRWLSPFSYQQAELTDVLIAIAVAVWGVELLLRRATLRLRRAHWMLGGYLLCVMASAVATSEARSTALQNLLITVELIALAVMTADVASTAKGRRLIAKVILAATLITAVEAAIGLALFYGGHSTTLVDSYSSYFKSSAIYARVQGGFYSPPLLGNFCIFASAIIAMDNNGLSRLLEANSPASARPFGGSDRFATRDRVTDGARGAVRYQAPDPSDSLARRFLLRPRDGVLGASHGRPALD
jgi:hypothetical protein